MLQVWSYRSLRLRRSGLIYPSWSPLEVHHGKDVRCFVLCIAYKVFPILEFSTAVGYRREDFPLQDRMSYAFESGAFDVSRRSQEYPVNLGFYKVAYGLLQLTERLQYMQAIE